MALHFDSTARATDADASDSRETHHKLQHDFPATDLTLDNCYSTTFEK
jgi:hypothetical protein